MRPVGNLFIAMLAYDNLFHICIYSYEMRVFRLRVYKYDAGGFVCVGGPSPFTLGLIAVARLMREQTTKQANGARARYMQMKFMDFSVFRFCSIYIFHGQTHTHALAHTHSTPAELGLQCIYMRQVKCCKAMLLCCCCSGGVLRGCGFDLTVTRWTKGVGFYRLRKLF